MKPKYSLFLLDRALEEQLVGKRFFIEMLLVAAVIVGWGLFAVEHGRLKQTAELSSLVDVMPYCVNVDSTYYNSHLASAAQYLLVGSRYSLCPWGTATCAVVPATQHVYNLSVRNDKVVCFRWQLVQPTG